MGKKSSKSVDDEEQIAAAEAIVDNAADSIELLQKPGAQEESCSICKKKRNALAIDNITLIRSPEGLICQSCQLETRKRAINNGQQTKPTSQQKQQQKPTKSQPQKLKEEPAPPDTSTSSAITAIKNKADLGKSISNPALERDLDEVIRQYKSELLQQHDIMSDAFGALITKKELDLIRTNVEYPPMCQRILITFKVARLSIDISHPVTDMIGADLNKNPEAATSPTIEPFLLAGDYSIRMKRSSLIEYLIGISVMIAEQLRFELINANLFERRAERWWGVLSKQLEDMQTRIMSLTGSFITLTRDPFEVNKIFASVYNAVSRLAALEQRMTKDQGAELERIWVKLKNDAQMDFYLKKFDTKYISLMQSKTKMEILDMLLGDAEIFEEIDERWEEIIVMVGKIRAVNRIKFLQALRTKLMPDEIEILAPELSKYRGRIFNEEKK